jgi:hypothetical protein
MLSCKHHHLLFVHGYDLQRRGVNSKERLLLVFIGPPEIPDVNPYQIERRGQGG